MRGTVEDQWSTERSELLVPQLPASRLQVGRDCFPQNLVIAPLFCHFQPTEDNSLPLPVSPRVLHDPLKVDLKEKWCLY